MTSVSFTPSVAAADELLHSLLFANSTKVYANNIYTVLFAHGLKINLVADSHWHIGKPFACAVMCIRFISYRFACKMSIRSTAKLKFNTVISWNVNNLFNNKSLFALWIGNSLVFNRGHDAYYVTYIQYIYVSMLHFCHILVEIFPRESAWRIFHF